MIGDAIWEDGQNRILKLDTVKQGIIFIEDIWNYRKLIIRLIPDNEKLDHKKYIIGDCTELGNL